jgi:hypothetical protein
VPDVLAYIDPGSAALAFQAAVAAIVAIPFLFRKQIARFARAVRRTDDDGERTTPPGAKSPR